MGEERERIVIFVRHAHRNTENRALDNGLSKKGEQQVQMLTEYFLRRFKKKHLKAAHFVTSPKKRCIETLTPVVQALEVDLQVSALLGEEDFQGEGLLKDRIQKFLEEVQASKDDWVICSHGDWIPEAIHHMWGMPVPLRKAGVVVFQQSAVSKAYELVELVSLWKGFSRILKGT